MAREWSRALSTSRSLLGFTLYRPPICYSLKRRKYVKMGCSYQWNHITPRPLYVCLCSLPPSPFAHPPGFAAVTTTFFASTEDFFHVNWHIFIAGSCRRRTTSRYCCAFPFIYKGRRYNSCTRTRHNRPWCALTPNYDRDKKWANCAGMGSKNDIFCF